MKGQWFWNDMSEKGAQETNDKEGHNDFTYQLTEYMARATMMRYYLGPQHKKYYIEEMSDLHTKSEDIHILTSTPYSALPDPQFHPSLPSNLFIVFFFTSPALPLLRFILLHRHLNDNRQPHVLPFVNNPVNLFLLCRFRSWSWF